MTTALSISSASSPRPEPRISPNLEKKSFVRKIASFALQKVFLSESSFRENWEPDFSEAKVSLCKSWKETECVLCTAAVM